ncbi:hypothetical protein SGRIM128S_04464 [Streptomyces griseomycini]
MTENDGFRTALLRAAPARTALPRTALLRQRSPERHAERSPRGESNGLDTRLISRARHLRLDVALRAAPGEVVALLGAGATTALRALAGLTPLTGGHLRLDDVALDRTPPPSPARSGSSSRTTCCSLI